MKAGCKLWFHFSCLGINCNEALQALDSKGASTWICQLSKLCKFPIGKGLRKTTMESMQPQLPVFKEPCHPLSGATWGKVERIRDLRAS